MMDEKTLNDIFIGAALAGVFLIVLVVWIALADARRRDDQDAGKKPPDDRKEGPKA